MSKLLVVIDGTAQSRVALERAIEIARALPRSEMVLLSVRPAPEAWQVYRPGDRPQEAIARRLAEHAALTAEQAGVRSCVLVVSGHMSEVVPRIAKRESCDHIFLPQERPGPVARALLALTGVCPSSEAHRIISLCDIPVTVFAGAAREDARGVR